MIRKRLLIIGLLLSISLSGCGKKDEVAMKMVDDINALQTSNLTLGDRDKVDKLLERYNSLTESQKKQVTNYIDLLNIQDSMDRIDRCFEFEIT